MYHNNKVKSWWKSKQFWCV